MLKPVIYFRRDIPSVEEVAAAKTYFPVVERRTAIEQGSLVIPRYSALPFNLELCADIAVLGGVPINSYREHCFVADLRTWYYPLADMTPYTWFSLDQIPKDGGPFVLKGATNSRKQLWSTHMYAENRSAAVDVYLRIAQDSHVGIQPIYIRQYIPLRRLDTGLNGLPISEEYRFFILDGEIIGSGFYWSSHAFDFPELPSAVVPKQFLDTVIARVTATSSIRFWVVDVAHAEDGSWLVIELNDGQQSGLSEIDPVAFYSRLAEKLHGRPDE